MTPQLVSVRLWRESRPTRRVVWAGAVSLFLLVAVAGDPAAGQDIQFGERPLGVKSAHVFLLTDRLEVGAGAVQEAELRFRVEPGFHINSHQPKDELLLPTELVFAPGDDVKVLRESYPTGTSFRLRGPGGGGPGETLDVYQGEFRVKLQLTARKGESTLAGTLKYQACDVSACFPPRSLPVRVLVAAR